MRKGRLIIRPLARIVLYTAAFCAALPIGCASTQSPAQMALSYRQMFNGALQVIHALHQQGKLGAREERQLLPAILAGSAALDQMDADAAAGDQAGFDVAAAAAQAALAQIQAVTHPSTAPSTAAAAADTADSAAGPRTRSTGPTGG